MTRVFIFCHGFGFDASFWNVLRPWFAQEHTIYLDLGYFRSSTSTPSVNLAPFVVPAPSSVIHATMPRGNDKVCGDNIEYIGIGHSLGFTKLLQSTIPFKRIVGVHGFVNFLGGDPTLRRRRQKELTQLTKQFTQDPILTLNQFYQRVGVKRLIPDITELNQHQMLQDLMSLNDSISMPNIPTMILGSTDDLVVPPILWQDNFVQYSNVHIEVFEQAQHGLGHLQPEWVYQQIMRFVREI